MLCSVRSLHRELTKSTAWNVYDRAAELSSPVNVVLYFGPYWQEGRKHQTHAHQEREGEKERGKNCWHIRDWGCRRNLQEVWISIRSGCVENSSRRISGRSHTFFGRPGSGEDEARVGKACWVILGPWERRHPHEKRLRSYASNSFLTMLLSD